MCADCVSSRQFSSYGAARRAPKHAGAASANDLPPDTDHHVESTYVGAHRKDSDGSRASRAARIKGRK